MPFDGLCLFKGHPPWPGVNTSHWWVLVLWRAIPTYFFSRDICLHRLNRMYAPVGLGCCGVWVINQLNISQVLAFLSHLFSDQAVFEVSLYTPAGGGGRHRAAGRHLRPPGSVLPGGLCRDSTGAPKVSIMKGKLVPLSGTGTQNRPHGIRHPGVVLAVPGPRHFRTAAGPSARPQLPFVCTECDLLGLPLVAAGPMPSHSSHSAHPSNKVFLSTLPVRNSFCCVTLP